MRPRASHIVIVAAAAALLAIAGSATIDAHKAITSKFTYNDDIYPILRDKCGKCHVDGGPAPMSLLTYNDDGGAVAWAESIKEMLMAGAMPPYYGDPTGPALKNNAHGLTPRELDKLLTWSAGGTPRGDLNHNPPSSKAKTEWVMGKPDLVIPFDKAASLGPGEMEKFVEVTLPTALTEAKWVKAADLLPGNAAIVRQATISVENGPVLAVWEPMDDPAAAPEGSAFKLPAGAKVHVKVRYRKSWQDEQETRTDKSSVGLYFTAAPASGKDIQSTTIDGEKRETKVAAAGKLLAVRAMVDRAYSSLEVTAVNAAGQKTPLLKLRAPRSEWPRRYWLAAPIDVPAGSTIQVTTVAADTDSGPLGPKFESPFQVALEFVPQ